MAVFPIAALPGGVRDEAAAFALALLMVLFLSGALFVFLSNLLGAVRFFGGRRERPPARVMPPAAGWRPGLIWPLLLATVAAGALFLGLVELFLAAWPAAALSAGLGHRLALVNVLVVEGAFVLALAWLLRRRRLGLWHLGLGRPRLEHVRDGVRAYFSVLPALLLLALVFSRFHGGDFARQEAFVMLREISSPLDLLLALVVIGLAAPFLEEVIFRGFLQGTLRNMMGPARAVVFSALVFAVLHFSPFLLPPIFLLGIAFALLYERTGSLWPPVVMHALNNTAAAGFLVLAERAFFLG